MFTVNFKKTVCLDVKFNWSVEKRSRKVLTYFKSVYTIMYEETMTEISEDNRFEWDSVKNEKNKVNHGLSFEQILPVFDDPYFLERYDSEHSSDGEDRYFGLGCMQGVIIVAASYTENKRIRIISARLASPKEEEVYNEYCKNINS